jgi:predicted transglutaminase-like cysteine proteinase
MAQSAIYVALRQAGIAARDLRLVIFHDNQMHEDHAVTAARLEGRWFVLDNRRMSLLSDEQIQRAALIIP